MGTARIGQISLGPAGSATGRIGQISLVSTGSARGRIGQITLTPAGVTGRIGRISLVATPVTYTDEYTLVYADGDWLELPDRTYVRTNGAWVSTITTTIG